MVIELSLSDVPDSLLSEAGRNLWHYTVGFLKLGKTKKYETADLLGTGVLVTAKGQPAILTAHHVLKVLPTSGRLGLVLSDKEENTNIDVNGINYVEIDRGAVDAEGPDIGFIRLSRAVSSAIGAKKSFYNLDKHREKFLSNPPRIDTGIWDIQGFIEQLTTMDLQPNRKQTVKLFCQYGAFGCVADYEEIGMYDYCRFPIVDLIEGQEPNNFGGVSGGGLWQFVLEQVDDKNFRIKESLLRGLVYYQEPLNEQGHFALRCHAHRSIYEHAYKEIAKNAP